MLAGLRPFVDRHPIVGHVRGSGLFLGVELVRDRTTLEPAGSEASYVANRLRELGILLGTDGPYHNVVKIRPPMPFDAEDADLLVGALDRVLGRADSAEAGERLPLAAATSQLAHHGARIVPRSFRSARPTGDIRACAISSTSWAATHD